MYALLIAEDADDVAIYSMALQRAGLAVTMARDLEQTMQKWNENPADLVLLSLPAPTPDEQVRRVRAETLAPLIVTINLPNDQLHCDLLKLGADLVITPATSIKILIAQIGVLIRRAGTMPAFSLPGLSTDGLNLNPENRTIDVANKGSQRLTHLEFRLLYTLMINRGQVIPTETIVERVWGYTGQGDRDLIRGLISRLRAKVEPDPQNPHYILTIPGVGYSFRGNKD